jgi:hypothetical protein
LSTFERLMVESWRLGKEISFLHRKIRDRFMREGTTNIVSVGFHMDRRKIDRKRGKKEREREREKKLP